MRIRSDVVLFAALLAGSSYAVATQVGVDPFAAATARTTGQVPFGGIVPDVTLNDWKGRPHSLESVKGRVATVLYFFSIECPCVDRVQPRVQALMDEFGSKGVEFVAVDGHPDDTAKAIFARVAELRGMYRVLLDPEQKLVRRLRVTGATDVVVLDAERRLVYRGTLDDDLVMPTTPYLRPVLEAVLAGRDPPFQESAKSKTYGCPFPGFDGECPGSPP
jgi:peroxiredoxin